MSPVSVPVSSDPACWAPDRPEVRPVVQRGSLRAAARFASCCLAPSLPFLLARQYLGMKAGEFNLDFVLAGLLYLVAGPWAAGIVFALICITEAVKIFNKVFYFSVADMVYASQFLPNVRPSLLVGVGGSVVAGLSLLIWLWLRALPARRQYRLIPLAAPICVIFLLLFALDAARGFNRIEARWGEHAVGESLINVSRVLPVSLRVNSAKLERSVAGTDPIRASIMAGTAQQVNVVLVLVESMGLLRDPGQRKAQLSLFDDPVLRTRYEIQESVAPFHGGTISGEMRELCGLRAGMRIDHAAAGQVANCLPRQLHALGFETESIHGYTGKMFQRREWHRAIGFDHSFFLEELDGLPGYHRCSGAFPGVCDADVMHHIDEELARLAGTNRHVFIHFITLNSHLPLPDGVAPPGPCFDGLPPEACKQLGYINRVLESVAATAEDPRIPPTAFVIVGDHAPPYVQKSRRELYSADTVPVVLLLPKLAQRRTIR